MSNIVIQIKYYGAFKEFGSQTEISLRGGCSLEEVKSALVEKIGENQSDLVHDSAIANDTEILSQYTIFNDDTALSILPPVCGG